MTLKTLCLACVIGALAAPSALAFGRDDRWTGGGAQGVREAIVTAGPANSILVTCAPGLDLDLTGITVTIDGAGPAGSGITLVYDDGSRHDAPVDEDGKINVNSRADMSHYYAAIADFRRLSRVWVRFEDGREASFTLRGSSQAISPCTDLY